MRLILDKVVGILILALLSLAGVTSAAASTPGISAITCHSTSFHAYGTDACTVYLSAAATTPTVVSISSNNSAVIPSSKTVTVATGAKSAAFSLTVYAVSITQTATLTASLNGATKTLNISLSPAKAGLTLSSLTCAKGSMSGAGTNSCSVTLSGGAPTGGQTVTLASNNSAVIVPSTVVVPAAATSAAFSATVSAANAGQTATITGSSGGVSHSFALKLTGTPSLSLSTSTISFGNVNIGQTATQAVVLKSTGTASVTISGISVAGSLFGATGIVTPMTLNPGQSATLVASFKPTVANPWNYTGTITITSNSSNGNLAASMTGAGVNGATLSSLTCAKGSMSGAGTDSCSVNLNGQAPAGGYSVTLKSNNSSVTVPSSVTVAQSATSASFNATVTAVSSSQTATITASAAGVSSTFALALTPSTAGTLSANATSLPFGEVYVGQSSAQSLTLTASGGSVVISSATATGNGFTVSGATFPLTLTSGQSATLDVQFAPESSGNVSGQLTIQNNSSKGTINLPLTGSAKTHAIELNWVAPSGSSVAGYNIYRAASGAPSYAKVNSSVNQTTTFSDVTCKNGQAYQYYVTSVDSAGKESAPSNTVTVTVPQ